MAAVAGSFQVSTEKKKVLMRGAIAIVCSKNIHTICRVQKIGGKRKFSSVYVETNNFDNIILHYRKDEFGIKIFNRI